MSPILFLTTGDSLYDCDHFYCLDCKRVWCHALVTYVKNEDYWEMLPFESLLNPDLWRGWIDTPPGPMRELSEGRAAFEAWLMALDEPIDARIPI